MSKEKKKNKKNLGDRTVGIALCVGVWGETTRLEARVGGNFERWVSSFFSCRHIHIPRHYEADFENAIKKVRYNRVRPDFGREKKNTHWTVPTSPILTGLHTKPPAFTGDMVRLVGRAEMMAGRRRVMTTIIRRRELWASE